MRLTGSRRPRNDISSTANRNLASPRRTFGACGCRRKRLGGYCAEQSQSGRRGARDLGLGIADWGLGIWGEGGAGCETNPIRVGGEASRGANVKRSQFPHRRKRPPRHRNCREKCKSHMAIRLGALFRVPCRSVGRNGSPAAIEAGRQAMAAASCKLSARGLRFGGRAGRLGRDRPVGLCWVEMAFFTG